MSAVDPVISIVVPFHNSAPTLADCLEAIYRGAAQTEIIVVDDHSNDNGAQIAGNFPVTLLSNQGLPGAAGARNTGAKAAKGEIILFVDSDVIIPEGGVARIRDFFKQNPNHVAVFGSYDDEPAELNFFSQYKNLMHHFTHQEAEKDSTSFWTGFGAIKKSVLMEMGGFDERYKASSIEDVELGLRLCKAGYAVCLDKTLQAKHLKKWTAVSLLQTDILYRAIPWSKLMLESHRIPEDLNFKKSHRVSAVLAWMLVPLLFWNFFLSGLVLALLIFLNRSFYIFLLKKRGVAFLFTAIFWHILYYLYSSGIFGLIFISHCFRKKNSIPMPAPNTALAENCATAKLG